MPQSRSERLSGLGRVLIAVYVVLAIAATFRSVFQIMKKFDEAPLAYSLSAVAGVVYIVATVALIMGIKGAHTSTGRLWRAVAWVALAFELSGVLIVGTLSLVSPELFAHPSVWSTFGIGYGFIPLVLPVLGLVWLRRTARASGAVGTAEAAA
ncbi:hypothetical protein [Leucobacter chromiireducens]|uniref:Integral membrane protein n=1 Tax=Leucobacter chromiireducens subsp. solipictus TaxID=398235 RepID=A0ABS1SK16_9MICO|nr:hypothetical protein [Leucobacter chromiireducens subsp. solipictus]